MKRFFGILVAVGMFLGLATSSASAQDDRYVMTASSAEVTVGNDAIINITLDVVTGTNGAPDNLQGFSYGVCHDATLATVVSVVDGAATEFANAGMPPAFNSINITPVPGDGFTVGVIIDLFGNFLIFPAPAQEINVATYNRTAAGEVALDFCGTLANPAVEVLVVNQAGVSADPVTVSGALTEPAPAFQFIRGDANQDGVLNITDVIFLALWLFSAGPAGDCDAAADVNDNGALNPLEDVLTLVQYLFQAGVAPAAPFPTCGPDATPDTLTCNITPCP